jgi:hypothetical protein
MAAATNPRAGKDTKEPQTTTPTEAKTSEPSTEGGPRTVFDEGGAVVTVESPSPVGGATQVRRPCVVKADFHIGVATSGSKVCSYHAMHYDTNGKPRQPMTHTAKEG